MQSLLNGTVLVPTHRGAHRLPDLLDALASQDYVGSWEVLVVVDGRLDESEHVLETYREKLPLRVILNEHALGVTNVMNTGIQEARGRVVIRCDDDLLPGPDFVRRHIAHHEGEERVGVIGPTRDVYRDSPYARAYGRPATVRSLHGAYSRAADQSWVGWAANNSALREVLLAVDGFDAAFIYGQDSELGYRLHKSGVRIFADAALETEHRGPSTAAATRVPRAFVSGASKRLFHLKHPGVISPQTTSAGLRDRVWRAAVGTVKRLVRTHAGYRRLGRSLDAVIQVVPAGIAARLIALAVEAAGAAGRRYGADDLASYKSQKTTELARELAQAPDDLKRNEE